MNAVVLPLHDNPLLSAALGYGSIGWHILPAWWIENGACACGNAACKSPGKHPIGKVAPWGQNSASTDADRIKQWWGLYPKANIAAYLEPSGLCAVDIDPRNGGIDTIDMIEAQHGPLSSDLLQFTGGGGEHRVFQKPGNMNMPGKLGAGVDVKLNGYIMLEPSNHISGKTYSWELSSDPRDGILASPLPDWLRDLAGAKPLNSDVPAGGRVVAVTQEQMRELEQAAFAVPSDDRETWLTMGMALHSTGAYQWAYDLWCRWSEQSAKFDPVDQVRVWRSFKGKGLDGLTYQSVFALAKKHGTVVLPTPVLDPAVEFDQLEGAVLRTMQKIEIDTKLLVPPGILGIITDYINQTARKPQPQFAVQTAIAFACTVLGRRFVTNYGNWPSLYLLNIGKSGSGKEWAKTTLENMLEACGLESLIGPSSYTSNAGVLSSLHDQPNHVTVIDEFHRELEAASIKGNARAQGTVRTLIEVWGRNGGVMRPQGYSTFGMSQKDKDATKSREVRNPALTLLAMTVPDFWEQIGSKAARDGFLNRFLIVESDIGRQVGNHVPTTDVPQTIIDWAQDIRLRYTDLMVDPDSNAGLSPNAVVVPITEPAMRLFSAFERECLELMDAHDEVGLAEMFGRTNEIAMKLALVLALGRNDVAVQALDAQWAIEYAKTYAKQAVSRLIESVADSEFEATKKQVLGLLTKAGGDGMTVAQLNDRSRRFRGMNQRQQVELLNSLAFVGQVKQVAFDSLSKFGGKKRLAWIAIENTEEQQP